MPRFQNRLDLSVKSNHRQHSRQMACHFLHGHYRVILSGLICLFIFGLDRSTPFPQAFAKTLSPKSHVNYYIETFGKADPKTGSDIARAYSVFDRIAAVADKRSIRSPHLQVIKQDRHSLAIALPDGFIVLSTHDIRKCYQNADQTEGDARLAFVLGHELGHMADDDFWHWETYMALTDEPEYNTLKNILKNASDIPKAKRDKRLAIIRSKEMQADDRGFMYAGIAGFRVDLLLGDGKGRHDFFTHWMQQFPHNLKDDNHPPPSERARFLALRLKQLLDKLEFFKYGVRLAHFQRYDDAIYFFREFQKCFPGREVFNNIGFCFLQQAITNMPSDIAFHYWLPIKIDTYSQAEKLKVKSTKGKTAVLSETAQTLLKEAIYYFKHACDADHAYLPSRLNLAAAHFYLKNFYDARAVIEQARTLAATDTNGLILKALIMLHEDPIVDMWSTAVKMLGDIVEKSDNACAMYNLAMLYKERGRNGKYDVLRKQLKKINEILPPPFRQNVGYGPSLSKAQGTPQTKNKYIPWPMPLKVGSDLYDDPKAAKIVSTWHQIDFNWMKEGLKGCIYRNADRSSALEIDGYVEMMVLPGDLLESSALLNQHFGPPLSDHAAARGRLLRYGPSVSTLSDNGDIKEIWIVRQ